MELMSYIWHLLVNLIFCCRTILGSVSDYCAKHVECPVVIVKKSWSLKMAHNHDQIVNLQKALDWGWGCDQGKGRGIRFHWCMHVSTLNRWIIEKNEDEENELYIRKELCNLYLHVLNMYDHDLCLIMSSISMCLEV